jgi:hypothetical protein
MAITSWTSENMDWSSADKLKLGGLYGRCEAIRLAIRERRLAAGLTPSGFFVENYELRLKSPKTFRDAVRSAVTALIPLFVNHLDHNGDWNGLEYSAFAPAWTEAALLTAISATERLELSQLETLSAWLYQQYQILNMLKWCRRTPTPSAKGKMKAGGANTYETNAWNNYVNASWIDATENHISMISSYVGDYSYSSYRAAFTGVVLEVDADFDLYEPEMVVSKIDGVGIAQSKLPTGVSRLMSSGTQTAGSAFDVLDADLGDVDRLPNPIPSNPYVIGSTGNGTRVAIYKPVFAFQETA